jgi:SAM-dependent methyltransferase
LESDPVPAERFDLTYSLMTLHHIHDVRKVLIKFHDLLVPHGYLLVADLDKEDGSFHTDGTTDVHKGFDRLELKRIVEEIGFKNVRFTTAYAIAKKIGNEDKTFPIFLMTAQKSNAV